MTYKLPNLPYAYNALEPHIDTRTMAIHHGKHHQAYVNNLNAALADYPDLQKKNVVELLSDLDTVPQEIRTAVRNSGGGHANHSLLWPSMSPNGGGQPTGQLAEAINQGFGSMDAFKTQFDQAVAACFGSGWAWLCVDDKGKLLITNLPNQDNPIATGLVPILGLDVWEHAYYLNYQNRRGDYIDAWWNVVNWDEVSSNLMGVKIGTGLDHAGDWVKNRWNKLEDGWAKFTGAKPE